MTTTAQRLAAIELGNGVRYKHCEERKRLQALTPTESREQAAAIFRNPGDFHRMKARYLIESIYRFGPVRTGKLIRKAALPAGRLDRRLEELTQSERDTIADYLENPDRPAQLHPDFSFEERILIQQVCSTIADHTTHRAQRNRLRAIVRKCEVGV